MPSPITLKTHGPALSTRAETFSVYGVTSVRVVKHVSTTGPAWSRVGSASSGEAPWKVAEVLTCSW